MKIERFIIEYANYLKADINDNKLMLPKIKQDVLKKIDDILRLRQKGLIAVCEAMRMLNNLYE